ncbi:MAG: copper resistance protein CopC/CopD [Thermogemmatispora sp.]|uniref:copper resistance protein CopC n=1 Tax=Thermogemmatispora sp. TaxID=1968838 RepID=UPI00262AF493|nr:copper resistance protein CopC [Thermogemmatispora sp.]MBX5456028.1 copper resistance protein CopC/CopD [Thermogemmatispora sp.]
MLMHKDLRRSARWRLMIGAALVALALFLLFPGTAEAHAVLLRSDPSQDALLRTAPTEVRLWFSEDLNPALSSAVVVNSHNQRVDTGNAHVSPSDPTELDLGLKADLPPDVYVVVWRSVSNVDGHVLRGSFLFTIVEPNGTVPHLNASAPPPGQDLLGGGNTSSLYTGQIDAVGLFNLVAVTLSELGAIFWMGAQLWRFFVLEAVPAGEGSDNPEAEAIVQAMPSRFTRRFAVPTLLMLLVANLGVLVGQALFLSNGQWSGALAPSLLLSMVTSSRFGTFWLGREVIILLALAVALYQLLNRRRTAPFERACAWLNLLLGLALFGAMTLSSHAAAVSSNLVLFSVLIDWLHLLGSAFWIGGMFYIVTCYLPLLERHAPPLRAQSLTAVLPYYSPWAIAGVLLLTITGPFSASFHLTSPAELITTAYGRALLIKIVLVAALLATSAFHVLLLRPRLKKEYGKYAYCLERLEQSQTNPTAQQTEKASEEPETGIQKGRWTRQLKLREKRLTRLTTRLTTVLRWEPLLGVGVLICVGLMNIFAGTLTPTTALNQAAPTASPTATAKPLTTSATTSDGLFTVTLTVSPNRFGTNTFTVKVSDRQTQRPVTQVGVTLYLNMLDMDMGTEVLNLQPAADGSFSGQGDLTMSGNWSARVQIRTIDNKLHETQIKFFTPF